MNIHEYLHSIVNPLVEADYDRAKGPIKEYFITGKDGPLAKTYQSPVTFSYECLVRALDHRMLVKLDARPAVKTSVERKVADEMEAREVRVASGREVLDATGFEPGAVAPFPRRDVIAALIERTLLQHQIVWIGAGSPAHMAMLAPSDLQRLAGARTADLVARS